MFGHQDDKAAQQTTNNIPEASIHGALTAEAIEPAVGMPAGQVGQVASSAPPPVTAGPVPANASGTSTLGSGPADDQPWQHPGQPLDAASNANSDDTPTSSSGDDPASGADDSGLEPAGDVITPTNGPGAQPQQAVAPTPASDSDIPRPAAADEPTTHELIDIKQQALGQLSPLMDHLDQTPEEKFRTTLMMIQASDDQTLIKTAYAAAQSIPDEKARAQALLDIVNEINYFTQQPPA
jgi:hypothetical protein